MTMAEDIAGKASGVPRGAAFFDSTFVLMCTIGRFLRLSTLFSPARRRRGVAPALPAAAAINVAAAGL